MPVAVITFDFDPLLRLGDGFVLRWQTLALAAVIAACLSVAAVMVRRAGLRAEDLLYITVGAVPGAIVAARLGYGLAHLDTFGPDPARLLDPAVGGLDLAMGVVGGCLTAAYVASLLDTPRRRWADVLALPLLVALGAGKLTMVLGGSGQGLPTEVGWATAYLGPGPWGSLAADLPSHPAQAYEGTATLVWALVLIVLASLALMRRADGRLLLVAIAGWALIRALVSVTWRDPAVIGPLGPAGLMALAVGVGAIAAIPVIARIGGASASSPPSAPGDPSWPDPASRPRF